MTDPVAFLRKVWDAQPDADHAFLAVKDWEAGTWSDHPVTLPLEDDDVGDDPDLYFAPVLFKERRRLKQHACGGVWLFADLDEVDPASLGYLPPQVAWETSPGRFQAMWRLEEPLGPKAWERLNRAITYRTGADKGGWSLTKVLRVPGTVSTKHGFDFTVRLVREDWEGRTDPARIRRVTKSSLPASDPATGRIRLPKASAREIRREHWAMLSPRARKLIRTKTVRPQDDRSARLWELENLLIDAGLTPGETVKVVQETVWNKYDGQRREMRMLMQEALRAEAKQREKGQVPERRKGTFELPEPDEVALDETGILPSMPLRKFMAKSYAPGGWLVEDIWDSNAFGFWAGEFKAYKTWTVLDFAVSVASGAPFLGRFRVVNPGHVLYLHDEGKPNVIQSQLHRILASKGASPRFFPQGEGRHGEIHWDKDIPLRISTMPMLDLTREEDRAGLLKYIRLHKPRAVILEAWYLITGEANENAIEETSPLMKWLMRLGVEEGTAIIVSHHYNKGSGHGVRAGARMSGSGVFGRVFESAVYLERKGEEEDHTVLLQSQHRAQEGMKTTIRFEIDADSDEDYAVHFLSDSEAGELEDVEMPGGKVLQMEPGTKEERMEARATELALAKEPFKLSASAPKGVGATDFRRWLTSLNAGWTFETVMVKGRSSVVGYPPTFDEMEEE